ncbi:MAG: hypothetical protein K6G08_09635, partial [Prevotella sp.]|nr:hypothetical protein [Prevotella sp.]
MNTHYYNIVLAAALLALGACTDENTFPGGNGYTPALIGHYLHLNTDHVTFASSSELSKDVSVESVTTPWQFTGISQEWLTLSPASGNGDATVTVVATENTSGSDIRTSVFTFQSTDAQFSYSRQMAVTQSHAIPYIHPAQNDIAFTASQGSIMVGISTNVNLEVQNDAADWLTTQLQADGLSLVLMATENLTTSSRSAKVTLAGGGITTTLNILQARASTPKVEPAAIETTPAGGSLGLTVTSEVAWTATTSEAWLSVSPASGQNGTNQIQLTAEASTSVNSRSAFVYFNIGEAQVATVPVTQAGLSLSLSPKDIILTANANERQLQIGCNTSWTVIEKPTWLTVSPMSGTGNGTLMLGVADYWGSQDKQGILTMGRQGTEMLQQVAVKQLGRTIPALAKQIVFGCEESSQEVTLDTDGKWTAAVSNDNSGKWLHVSPAAGTGSATLTISAEENTSEDTREGTVCVTIADSVQNIQVVQQGITPFIAVEHEAVALTAAAQSNTVGITSNIEWTATTDAAWMTVDVTANRNGIVIRTEENLSDHERQAMVTISGSHISKQVEVTQAKASAPVTETTGTLEFENVGGTYQMEVSSEVAWTANTPYEWLDVDPKEGEAGKHALTIAATPNTRSDSRNGFVYIYIGGRSEVVIPIHQRGIYIELSEHSLTFTADA